MTEFTREEVMRAAAHMLQSARRPDLLRVACFLRNIFYLEAAVSDTYNLVIHLVFLPFHHRTELGFWMTWQLLHFGERVLLFLASSCFPFLCWFLSHPPHLLLLTLPSYHTRNRSSLLSQRDASFIQLFKKIKQSFPFPWTTCSKYKWETNYKGEDKSPLNSWSSTWIWRLIFGLNHRVMPGSSLEQIVPLASTVLTLKCVNWVSFPMDYEGIWWRLLILMY